MSTTARTAPAPVAHLGGPSVAALKAATAAGFSDGERHGYVAGWRWGLVCGGVVAGLGGSIGVVVCKALGWL